MSERARLGVGTAVVPASQGSTVADVGDEAEVGAAQCGIAPAAVELLARKCAHHLAILRRNDRRRGLAYLYEREIDTVREADVVCIDCVTYALLECYRPEALFGTRMLGWTDGAPAPPYVTRLHVDGDTAARMRCALHDMFDGPDFRTTRQK